MRHLQWDPTAGEAQGPWGGRDEGLHRHPAEDSPQGMWAPGRVGGELFCPLWVISEAVSPVGRVPWLQRGNGGRGWLGATRATCRKDGAQEGLGQRRVGGEWGGCVRGEEGRELPGVAHSGPKGGGMGACRGR